MKTFEELFTKFIGEKLAVEMGETLTERGLSVLYEQDVEYSTDLFYEPLKKNPNGVVVIVSTTNSTQTNVPNIDFTTDFFNVRIVCDENKKTALFQAIDRIRTSLNAKFSTLVDGNTTYNYQLSINKPYVSLNIDIPTEEKDDDGVSETIGCIVCQWIISAVYSTSIPFGAETFKLLIGSAEYTINGLVKYQWHQGTSDIITQYEGQSRQARLTAVYTDTYVLIFNRIANDSLCTYLDGTMQQNSANLLYNKFLQLKIGSRTISIASYSVDKAYENGVATYTLTLVK